MNGIRIVSIEQLRAARRQGTFETRVPFVLDGKVYEAVKKIVNGEMETYSLARPIGEMLTTADLRKDMMQKVVLDVELGREDVPLLYQPVYERLEDPNFPEVFDAKWVLRGTVVFTERVEGEEVKFGRIQAEAGPIARIFGYAAGFEYTEEMELYNQTFAMEMLNKSFGEAYNALLNHIHLSPIMSYSYPAGNKTAAQGTNEPRSIRVKLTLQKALEDAGVAKRPGTVLLAPGARRYEIEAALKEQTVNGTSYPGISDIETIIYYDSWSIQVGKKTFEYAGVPSGKAYLIRPKRGFKELVKQDLRVDANIGDLSRLVMAQIVGRAYRGVFAAPEQNVQEITLPT